MLLILSEILVKIFLQSKQSFFFFLLTLLLDTVLFYEWYRYFTLNFQTCQSHKNSDSAAVQPIFVTLAHWKVEQIFGKLSLSTVPVQFTFFNESTNSARCTSQSSQSTKITNRAGIICARYCKYVEYFTFFLEISASWASIESLTFRGSCELSFAFKSLYIAHQSKQN